MSQHFIEICRKCAAVIKQCRCPGPKATTYSLCIKCSTAEKNNQKKKKK